MKTTNSISASGKRSRSRAVRAFRIVLALVALLVLLPAGGWLWLQSGPGKAWLARTLSAKLSGFDGRQVEFTGLRGLVPVRMGVDEIVVSDADGTWLRAKNVTLDWSLPDLAVRRRVTVHELSADNLEIDRRPTWQASETSSERAAPRFSLPPIVVRTVEVRRVALDAALLGQEAIFSLRGHCAFGDEPERISGRLHVQALESARSEMTLDAGYHFRTGKIQIDASVSTTPEGLFSRLLRTGKAGEIDVGLVGSGTIERWVGNVRLDASNWGRYQSSLAAGWRPEPWLAVTGDVHVVAAPLEGKAIVGVRLAADEAGTQILTADAEIFDLTSPWGTVEELSMQVRAQNIRDLETFEIDLTAHNARHDDVALENLSLRMVRSNSKWDLEMDAKGEWREPITLRAGGDLTLTAEKQSLRLGDLRASYGDLLISSSAVSLDRQQDEWMLDASNIDVADGRFDVFCQYGPEIVTGRVSVANLPLNALPIGVDGMPSGRLGGHVWVNGHPSRPVMGAEAHLGLDTPPTLKDAGVADVLLSGQASVEGGELSLHIEMRDDLVGEMEVDAKMPCIFTLSPFQLALPRDEPMSARSHTDLDLSFVNRLAFLENQNVQGGLTAEFSYDGLLRDFSLKGTGRVEGGAYEHYLTGTLIEDVTADLGMEEGDLVLERCEGTDGGLGRVGVTGRVLVEPAEGFPFAFQVTASDAVLLRQDHITAAASARLDVTGSVRRVDVRGDVSVVSGEFNIDRLPPAMPPVLQVVEMGQEPAPEATGAAPVTPQKLQGELRIGLDGPFFVRGAGIESVWRGDLNVWSDGGPWRVQGTLRPRRGTYEFFGRRFTLVNSSVHLDGAYPVVPVLDVTAEHERQEIKARLRITGRLDDPQIQLESEPDLPQDEIMSRILFGAEASGLTPIQTAQLGLAVASMTGGGGGSFDFMGRTRDFLSVDELGVRENRDDPSQVELVAGRFVSDRLFLEYSQRVGARDAGVRAEFELNRHLSIETNAGAQLRPGIRLNIKVDY